jgi:hypothetical protein
LKKLIKYFGLTILTVWFLIASFFSYLFLRGGWEEMKHDKWEALTIPEYLKKALVSQQLDIEAKEEELSFHQKIKPLKSSSTLEQIQKAYEYDRIEISLDSYEYLQDSFQLLFEKWPTPLKQFSNEHIYRVYVVKNIPSSAGIFQILNTDKFVVIVNEDVIKKEPNYWMTETEKSSFRYTSNIEKLEVIIENDSSPILTLENILIHEIGHAFGVVHRLTTDFDHKLKPYTSFQFYHNSYSNRIEFEPINKYAGHFKALTFYGYEGDKLSFIDYSELLNDLDKTSFPTMYSSKNELEFFAEMFYSYVHCELQKKPFRYIITDADGKIEEFSNGIKDERCEYERNIIAKYFEENESNIL